MSTDILLVTATRSPDATPAGPAGLRRQARGVAAIDGRYLGYVLDLVDRRSRQVLVVDLVAGCRGPHPPRRAAHL